MKMIIKDAHPMRKKAPSVQLRGEGRSRSTVQLDYEFVPAGRQSRLKDRFAISPAIDLKKYRVRAEIDWLEIGVRLQQPTQARWINDKLFKETGVSLFVEPIPVVPGVDVEFTLRIQEPEPAVMLTIVEVLEAEWGIGVPPTVEAIEVAIDFYPKSHSVLERDRMLGVLTHHHDPDINLAKLKARPRSSAGVGKIRYMLARGGRSAPKGADGWLHEYDDPTVLGWTYYVGRRDDPVSWRVMDKVKDRQNRSRGTFEALDDSMKRTRIEVTIKRPEIGMLRLAELSNLFGYRFSSFQNRYFRFSLPTVGAAYFGGLYASNPFDPTRERMRLNKFLKSGIVGLRVMEEARRAQRSKWRPALRRWARQHKRNLLAKNRAGTGSTETYVSYGQMMKQVEYALRHLEERWRVV